MDTKICSKCKKEKTLDNFHRYAKSKDGHKPFCKECKLAYDRKYREDPRYRERMLEHKRQYRRDNAEHENKKKKEWYEREPWRKTHKSIMSRCYQKDHWYSKHGVKNFLTPEDLKMLWFRDKAFEMDKPSIDRKDETKDYMVDNCRYIEHRDNNRGPKK